MMRIPKPLGKAALMWAIMLVFLHSATAQVKTEGAEDAPKRDMPQGDSEPDAGKIIYKEDIFQDLRNKKAVSPSFTLLGEKLLKFAVPDNEGLHVKLPADRKETAAIGLQAKFSVHGDFEITASYDLASAAAPSNSQNVCGVNLFVMQGPRKFARLGRFRMSEEHVYQTIHAQSTMPPNIERFPTSENAGQLRFVREGTQLRFLVKDATTEGKFKELKKADFGLDDVTSVRFSVNTDNKPLAVDARLIDLRIRSGGVVEKSGQETKPPAGRTPKGPADTKKSEPEQKTPVESAPKTQEMTGLKEYQYSFKGKMENDRGFSYIGPQGEACVKFEPDGLRLTLPTGQDGERKPTGLTTGIGVQGNFEITVGFTVLKEPRPENVGWTGTRFGLLLGVGVDPKDILKVSWAVRPPPKATTFVAWSNAFGEKEKRPSYVPTKSRVGRLRLVRNGSSLAYYAAEGDNGFTLIREHPLGKEELHDVSLFAQTGGPDAEIDVRFTDLVIRAESLSYAPASGEDGAPTASDQPKEKNWLLAVLLAMTLGLALAAALGLWLYRSQSNRTKTLPAQKAAPKSPVVTATPAAIVSFTCSCGKILKAKAELAGKKVKCPQCSMPVLVPGA